MTGQRCLVALLLNVSWDRIAFAAPPKCNGRGLQIWQSIQTGAALDDPTALAQLLVVMFAGLKKCQFHYWFAFPALMVDPPATVRHSEPLRTALSREQVRLLSDRYFTPPGHWMQGTLWR